LSNQNVCPGTGNGYHQHNVKQIHGTKHCFTGRSHQEHMGHVVAKMRPSIVHENMSELTNVMHGIGKFEKIIDAEQNRSLGQDVTDNVHDGAEKDKGDHHGSLHGESAEDILGNPLDLFVVVFFEAVQNIVPSVVPIEERGVFLK
jgi:hypothetical protein